MHILVKTEHYGEVIYNHIATMIFAPKPVPGASDEEAQQVMERIIDWANQYHPRIWFRLYYVKSTRPDLPTHAAEPWKTQQAHPYELFIPSHTANKDWAEKNRTCKYMQRYKDPEVVRSLPIGIPDSDIEKWLTATENMQMIVKRCV